MSALLRERDPTSAEIERAEHRAIARLLLRKDGHETIYDLITFDLCRIIADQIGDAANTDSEPDFDEIGHAVHRAVIKQLVDVAADSGLIAAELYDMQRAAEDESDREDDL